MKIKNETHYVTRDLSKIIRRACKAVGCRGKSLTVTVTYAHKHGRVTGYAYLGCIREKRLHEATCMRLRLPFDAKQLDLAELCWVAMHEAQHLIGVGHRDMSDAIRTCNGPLPTWAEGLQIRVKKAPTTTPEERKTLASMRREARARKALAKWIKAERHAANMRRKWSRTVAYYDRKVVGDG